MILEQLLMIFKCNSKKNYLHKFICSSEKIIDLEMKKKIILMGLQDSGKTTLAYKLKKDLKADWVNADQIRKV